MRTSSMSFSVVTRRPSTNVVLPPSAACSVLTSSPPPCTSTRPPFVCGPARRERTGERGIRLRAPADLDDARHGGNPAVSSRPSIRFAFCTAWPAAPFRRLSIADVTSSVGVRVPANGDAEMRTTFRWTTS